MIGISIGIQIEAPNGFESMDANVRHYFLRSCKNTNRILLIKFLEREAKITEIKPTNNSKKKIKKETPTPLALMVVLSRHSFEDAVGRQIRICEAQYSMPPWIIELEGKNLTQMHEKRRKPKKLHSERNMEKFQVIEPLVMDADEILESSDPDKIINIRARSFKPKKNETRVRLWFYVYILFGFNIDALHYSTTAIGKWSRYKDDYKIKRGRPHKYKGKESGYNVNADVKKNILVGWAKFAKSNTRMSTIFEKTLLKVFKCKTREIKEGNQIRKVHWHPDGKPFPTNRQFTYQVIKAKGIEAVQRAIFGYARTRNKISAIVGSFTQHVWNLMQVVESDGYSVDKRAIGLIEGSTLPPLYVIRRRDTASGMITGIGFSQGGENSNAYRMAKFCEAICKVKFCSLFGYEITSEMWPSIGVSPKDIQDRGPGATPNAFAADENYQPVVKEGAPAYSGQSKAVSESSHPKSISTDDPASHIVESKRPHEIIVGEIEQVLKDVQSIYVRSRVPPELAVRLTAPTSIGVWNLLAEVGRNDAISVSFETAVRTWLTEVPAKLEANIVHFHGIKYRSKTLDNKKILRKANGDQIIPIKVYVLDACVRHIWFDYKGELIELNMTFDIPVADKVFNMSLEELKNYEEFISRHDSFHEEHIRATANESRERYKKNTGKDWDEGKRVSGSPNKKSAINSREAREAKGTVNRKGNL